MNDFNEFQASFGASIKEPDNYDGDKESETKSQYTDFSNEQRKEMLQLEKIFNNRKAKKNNINKRRSEEVNNINLRVSKMQNNIQAMHHDISNLHQMLMLRLENESLKREEIAKQCISLGNKLENEKTKLENESLKREEIAKQCISLGNRMENKKLLTKEQHEKLLTKEQYEIPKLLTKEQYEIPKLLTKEQ
eukprot:135731_1